MSATSKFVLGLNDNVSVLFGVFLFAVVFVITRTRNSTRRVPPGPPPAFLLGNARHLPKVRPWLKLHEWGRKYGAHCPFKSSRIKLTSCGPSGDVISFTIFSRQFIVVESYEAACALFEKRSSVYSQRPQRVMAQM